jgi:hypothetical protein
VRHGGEGGGATLASALVGRSVLAAPPPAPAPAPVERGGEHPYAGLPAGEGRFTVPPMLEPWTGVRDALVYGPQSIRPPDPGWPKWSAVSMTIPTGRSASSGTSSAEIAGPSCARWAEVTPPRASGGPPHVPYRAVPAALTRAL